MFYLSTSSIHNMKIVFKIYRFSLLVITKVIKEVKLIRLGGCRWTINFLNCNKKLLCRLLLFLILLPCLKYFSMMFPILFSLHFAHFAI